MLIKALIMMMMNCFCGMLDRRKAFSLISSRDHFQRCLPSRISDTPRAGFEPAQHLIVERRCAVVITTTPRRHKVNPGIQFRPKTFNDILCRGLLLPRLFFSTLTIILKEDIGQMCIMKTTVRDQFFTDSITHTLNLTKQYNRKVDHNDNDL